MPEHDTSRSIITTFGSGWEWIVTGDIDLQHVGIDQQMAGIFTKALGADKLHLFSMALSLRSINTPSLYRMLEGENIDSRDLT